MVGERYRDLIEAADTITAMKRHSRTILENVETLRKLQTNNYRNVSESRKKTSDERNNLKYRETAATIRLLTILPERIFQILSKESEHESILFAAKCYLLGERVSSGLVRDSAASGILAAVPVLNSKIAQLQDSRENIITAARKTLKAPSLSETRAKDSLLALAMIKGENFNFLQEYISCRNDGLAELLKASSSTDTLDQMEELGIHLHNSIKLFDALFHHGNASPLVNLPFISLNDLLGASAELWPRFLPMEIDAMTRTGFTINFTPPPSTELKESANNLLQQACNVITESLPMLLERVTTGERLAQLRDSIHKSISLSTRDALLGDWNAIVNRVFDGEDDLQTVLFETLKSVFSRRLEGIIESGMTEIEQNVETGLHDAINEFDENGVFNFNISTFIWSQTDHPPTENSKCVEVTNVDWARKNLSLRAKSFHPIVVSVVQMASERFDLLLKDVKKFTTDRYVLRSHAKRFVEFFSEFSTRYCKEGDNNPELALFIARCCYAMTELCEPLQSSLADEWPQSKDKLIARGDVGINIWTGDLGSKVGKLYFDQFPAQPDENLLHLMPTLAHQVVSEESESGTKVESEIDVPQYLRIGFFIE